MRRSSFRSRSTPFFALATVSSALAGGTLALFACGDSSSVGGDTRGQPDTGLPDVATVTEDGAIVDQDGNVVMPPDAAKPSKVAVTTESIMVAGDSRGYVLSVPKTYDARRKYPLIVALHGDGGSADGLRVELGLDDLAGDDAILAYPDHVVDLDTPYAQNGDQQLVEAVILALEGRFSIDPDKVWGFGYSKGGFMVNQLACRKPGLFKAIAAHATGAPQDRNPDTSPNCPGVVGLPVMATEGDSDMGIGADFAAMYWAGVNGCGTTRTTSTPAACQTTDGCPAGKPVVFCLAPGVAHAPMWSLAAQVSWAFYKSL